MRSDLSQREIDILDEEPERDAATSLVIECWQSLDSCRYPFTQTIPAGPSTVSFAYTGPIPHSAITDWCRWHQLDYEAGEMVIETISRLDSDRMQSIRSQINLST